MDTEKKETIRKEKEINDQEIDKKLKDIFHQFASGLLVLGSRHEKNESKIN